MSTLALTPRTAISATPARYENPDEDGYKYKRRIKSQKSKDGGSTITTFFESKLEHLLQDLPDASEFQNLQVGDVFRHTAQAFNPPKHQLWLREVRDDGDQYWQPVKIGHPHPKYKGKVLWLTNVLKEPSWVTLGYYKRALKDSEKGTPSKRKKAD
ncbi:hypothetical protein NUW54_g14652 [Trametes sanguinea]|uniref:Uncharacterized protein n=1 Tax=Trametes sanguinea TaxID=158606 RepID=A0ACC1MBX7_9APHY|nr:hypothetical protein NUW54_g14652 [Trametes sanguinea]